MTYEAQEQIGKAIRSLPWYMFMVPALLTLFLALFDMEAILSDKDPQLSYCGLMWIIAKLGFFVWVLRQLLRYAVFRWITKIRSSFFLAQPTTVAPSTQQRAAVRTPSSDVTIISRREIPRRQRQAI